MKHGWTTRQTRARTRAHTHTPRTHTHTHTQIRHTLTECDAHAHKHHTHTHTHTLSLSLTHTHTHVTFFGMIDRNLFMILCTSNTCKNNWWEHIYVLYICKCIFLNVLLTQNFKCIVLQHTATMSSHELTGAHVCVHVCLCICRVISFYWLMCPFCLFWLSFFHFQVSYVPFLWIFIEFFYLLSYVSNGENKRTIGRPKVN